MKKTWFIDSTLGTLQGNKNAFYFAQFVEDDQVILAYTYNGAMNKWRREDSIWKQELTLKGHFGEVTALDYNKEHDLILTCSLD